MNDYSGMHSVYGYGMSGWMFLWWIFLIVLIAGSLSLFLRRTNFKNDKSPLDILKERYAKGEINKQEFEEKKADIL